MNRLLMMLMICMLPAVAMTTSLTQNATEARQPEPDAATRRDSQLKDIIEALASLGQMAKAWQDDNPDYLSRSMPDGNEKPRTTIHAASTLPKKRTDIKRSNYGDIGGPNTDWQWPPNNSED